MPMKMSDAGLRIEVPETRPFTKEPVCRTCGYAGRGRWYKVRAWLLGKQPKLGCGIYRHCLGSKPPSEERSFGTLIFGASTVEYNCSGIFRAHLHVVCDRCQDHWLMACAGD